jgi:type III secretion protein V
VAARVATLENTHPELVREVIPRRVSRVVLAGVLRRLVDEGVSVRDLRTIFEALAEHGAPELDAATLTEHVRAALSAQLAHAHAGLGRPLGVVLLDPLLEEVLEGAIPAGEASAARDALTLEPELSRSIVDAIREAIAPLAEVGLRPALLTTSRLRRRLRRLIEIELAPVAVLAFDELPPELVVQPLATARL